jgi:hypothetical protein
MSGKHNIIRDGQAEAPSRFINMINKDGHKVRAMPVDARELKQSGYWEEGTEPSAANDYSSMKVDELKAELDRKGIEYSATAKKADLVDILSNAA